MGIALDRTCKRTSHGEIGLSPVHRRRAPFTDLEIHEMHSLLLGEPNLGFLVDLLWGPAFLVGTQMLGVEVEGPLVPSHFEDNLCRPPAPLHPREGGWPHWGHKCEAMAKTVPGHPLHSHVFFSGNQTILTVQRWEGFT